MLSLIIPAGWDLITNGQLEPCLDQLPHPPIQGTDRESRQNLLPLPRQAQGDA